MNAVKILKWSTLFIIVVLLVVAIIYVTRQFKDPGEPVPVANIEPAKIIDVRPMVKMCTMEIQEEIPVRGKIGSRHLFGKARMLGTISFDLETLQSRWQGDTLMVVLPAEIVDIRESTEPGSYKVIDRWNDHLFGSSNFTTSEENGIKRAAVEKWREEIYNKGYVRRARSEAVTNLEGMLRPFVGDGTVITIIDPIPEGRMRDSDESNAPDDIISGKEIPGSGVKK